MTSSQTLCVAWKRLCIGLPTPRCAKQLQNQLFGLCHWAGLKIAFLQEVYADTGTLESRLQDVARRMVNHQGGRRPEAGRPPMGPSLPQSNGFAGPTASAGSSYGAGAGFGSGGPVNQLLNQPSRTLPQTGFLSDTAPGLPQTSGAGHAAGGPGSLQGTGQTTGLMSRGAASPQLSGAPAMPMAAPTVPKTEPGLGNLQLSSPQYGLRPAGLQPGPGMLQSPTPGPSGQPVMSNGAPVLLRGSRDWAPAGPSAGLVNVRWPNLCLLSLLQTCVISCSD